MRYTIHRHQNRFGVHYDLRLVLGQRAESWVLHNVLPREGDYTIAIPQPAHEVGIVDVNTPALRLIQQGDCQVEWLDKNTFQIELDGKTTYHFKKWRFNRFRYEWKIEVANAA